jgi:pimeloyl-ACP methyl ester carboxylesterase
VGGVPKLTQYANSATLATATTPWQQLIIGQMYVQFMIPDDQRGWPVIMVHGGGYSGSGVESTPDGHEGWFAYSVRQGNATYVVDQAGRGRSGFDRSFIHERVATGNTAGFPSLGATSSSGIWTAWFGHLINGTDITNGLLIKHGDPGDPECATNPAHCTFNPAHNFDTVDPDIQARVGAIGPAANPANNKQLALEHYKWGVPNTNTTLPGSFCAGCTPQNIAGDVTWSGQDLAKLVVKLGGAIVATHSQSGAVGQHMARYLKEAGQLNKLKALITIDGSCSLPAAGTTAADFKTIPYMALRGYYPSGISSSCDVSVADINAIGGKAEFIKLDDPKYKDKFKGVTHMMMMGIGHLDVFDVIQKWVAKNVPGSSKKVSCPRANNRDDPEDFRRRGR